jgi:hypothetical protein
LGSSKDTFDRALFGFGFTGLAVSSFSAGWLASVGALLFGGAIFSKNVRLETGADDCFLALALVSNILAVD